MSWPTTDYRIPTCLSIEGNRCDALLVDLDGDGAAEVLVLGGGSSGQTFLFKEGAHGTWESRGALPQSCQPLFVLEILSAFQIDAKAIPVIRVSNG